MGSIIFSPFSDLCSSSRTGFKTRVTSLLPPVVSGGGTSLFLVILHLHRSFLSSYSNYKFIYDWLTYECFGLTHSGISFQLITHRLSATKFLFFFLFFSLSLFPEIYFLFFFQFQLHYTSICKYIYTHTHMYIYIYIYSVHIYTYRVYTYIYIHTVYIHSYVTLFHPTHA